MTEPTARVVDVSLTIGPELLTYPGNSSVRVLPVSRLSDGGSSNVSELHLGSHTGTHVDAPAHFLRDGPTVDELRLDVLIGAATVADLSHASGPVGTEELEGTVPA